jgi:predicted DNA-binding transcriptional regulator AlpA
MSTDFLSYYVDFKEINRMVGISRQTIDRDIKTGAFPKKVRITTRRVRWLRSEIEEWKLRKDQERNVVSQQVITDGPHNIFKPI